MDLFFYGTLRHLPLLHCVLGASSAKLLPARLQGFQARAIKGEDFPTIVEMDGEAEGVLCQGLSEEDVARLNFYEGGFNYELRDVALGIGGEKTTAQVYFPLEASWQDNGPWSLDHWVAEFGDLATEAAGEVMSHFGEISAEKLEFMFPMIRARAAARLAASSEAYAESPSGFGRQDTDNQGDSISHRGFFLMKTSKVAFRQYDGAMSAPVAREVFVGGDAAIVLPYDPKRDRVLLIEQFRAGPYVRGDQKPWMLEPIAGRIDPGETPEATARREGLEEANLSYDKLHAVSKCYASPGCNTEFFHIFVAEADLPDDITGISGLESEAEDIKSYLFSYDTLMEMVDRFAAANAPLVLAALWLARHRETLRSTA